MRQADVIEARRDFERAEELRKKALELSEEYLSPSAQAELERQRASLLINQGRFNEALVLLSNARDRFGEENDPLNLASVTADISNIFKWMGDYDQALTEAKQATAIIELLISGQVTQMDIMSSLFSGQFQKAQDQAKLLQISLALDQILDLLAKRDQAAITLFYQPHRVISILLKDRKCSMAAVEVSKETHTALAQYRENLQSTRPRPQHYDPSVSLNLKAEQLISDQILTSALQTAGLIIIPYGTLYLLPWAGLEFNNKRLFKYCPISIAPNLSCISNLQADFSVPPRVALIGAPDYNSLLQLQPLNLAMEELQTI